MGSQFAILRDKVAFRSLAWTVGSDHAAVCCI